MSMTVLLKGAPSQSPLAERRAGEGGGAEARQSRGVGWGKGGQAETFEEELIAMATQLPRLSL